MKLRGNPAWKRKVCASTHACVHAQWPVPPAQDVKEDEEDDDYPYTDSEDDDEEESNAEEPSERVRHASLHARKL